MRPNRSTAARTASSASARLVTSSLTASRSLDCPKALDTRSRSRPEATTAWPAARAALAKSTPMPRPAPVISQIFLLLMTSLSPTDGIYCRQEPQSWFSGKVGAHEDHRGASRRADHRDQDRGSAAEEEAQGAGARAGAGRARRPTRHDPAGGPGHGEMAG